MSGTNWKPEVPSKENLEKLLLEVNLIHCETIRSITLMCKLMKMQLFNDGNKRSSIWLGSYFLEINGFGYVVPKFVKEMENIVVWVAEGKISKEFLKELIASIIYDDEYPEDLHFRLMLLVEDGTFG